MKKITLLILFPFLIVSGYAQNGPATLVAAMPSKENVKLIDSLVTACRFDIYFYSYCADRIETAGKISGWDSVKIQTQKGKISLEDFKEYTLYNALSSYSKKDIETLISRCSTSEEQVNLILSVITRNSNIKNNLPIFINRYLK